MADGITPDESQAIVEIGYIVEELPEFGKAVLRLWWVSDDILRVERYALSDLLWLARIDPALAWQAIGEPFMEPPFRHRDQYALGVLRTLASDGLHSDERHALLAKLSGQPWFGDGLDDLDAAVLYAISNTWGDFRQDLVDAHYVASATVTLPLSGIVDTVVVRHTPFPPNDHTFVALEEGLRAIEDFMGMPFPVNDVILILTDRSFLSAELEGQFRAFSVGDRGVDSAYMTAHIFVKDSEFGPLKSTIYHELGHYYVLSGPLWLAEGAAHLLENYTHDRLGVESIEQRLSYLGKVSEPIYGDLDATSSTIYGSSRCDFNRRGGERFVLEMYVLLGPEALAAALRELHLRSRRFLRLNEDTIYHALVSQTTEENREAFEAAYRRHHGGPIVDSVPEDSPDWSPLVALYESTNGLDWAENENWSVNSVPLGVWSGVSTDLWGRVRELYLEGNSLAGELPPELGNLSSLEQLRLAYNSLSGKIPPELGRLFSLTSLDLTSNRLDGEIPIELGNLSNLTSLALWGNRLTGQIPSSLGNLSSLRWLDISWNSLSGKIPPELSNLTNLEYLSLGRNQLSGEIPPELGNLSNLEGLLLPANRLTGQIPPELGVLTNLGTLRLSWNHLSGEIPTELGSLSNLSELNLSHNLVTGAIPVELGSLSNLTSLDLGSNDLTGTIPVELGSLSNLWKLDLSGNRLTGEIPSELGSLTNLHSLFLAGNRFTGCVPAGLRKVAENDLHKLGLPFCGAP